jgi:hypothetical protein
MDTRENTPLPEDPPVTVGDGEVERLLDKAQEMAEEIAASTGVDPGAPDPQGAPQAPADQTTDQTTDQAADQVADPLAGAESIEKTLAELGDLLNDTPSVAEGSEADAAAGQADENPPEQVGQDVAAQGAEAPPARADETAVRDSPAGESVAPVKSVGPSEAADGASAEGSSPDFDNDLAGDVNVDLSEPLQDAEPEDVAQAPDQAEKVGPRTKRSIKKLIAAARNSGRHVAKPAAITLVNAVLIPFLVLDRPFVNLSPVIKRRIGYLGLITVLMGIMSLVLPGMFEHNPYEHLEP